MAVVGVPSQFVTDLLNELGLKQVFAMTIRFERNKPVTLDVTMAADGDALEKVFRQYHLTAVPAQEAEHAKQSPQV